MLAYAGTAWKRPPTERALRSGPTAVAANGTALLGEGRWRTADGFGREERDCGDYRGRKPDVKLGSEYGNLVLCDNDVPRGKLAGKAHAVSGAPSRAVQLECSYRMVTIPDCRHVVAVQCADGNGHRHIHAEKKDAQRSGEGEGHG